MAMATRTVRSLSDATNSLTQCGDSRPLDDYCCSKPQYDLTEPFHMSPISSTHSSASGIYSPELKPQLFSSNSYYDPHRGSGGSSGEAFRINHLQRSLSDGGIAPPMYPYESMSPTHPLPHPHSQSLPHPHSHHNAPIIEGMDIPPLPLTQVAQPDEDSETREPPIQKEMPKRKGKMPAKVVDILMEWLNENSHHPYPSEQEKKDLMKRTQLSQNQVSNWFINARRRKLPLIIGGELKIKSSKSNSNNSSSGMNKILSKRRSSREDNIEKSSASVGGIIDSPFLTRSTTWQQPSSREIMLSRYNRSPNGSTIRSHTSNSSTCTTHSTILPPITLPPIETPGSPTRSHQNHMDGYPIYRQDIPSGPVILPPPNGLAHLVHPFGPSQTFQGYGMGFPELTTGQYEYSGYHRAS